MLKVVVKEKQKLIDFLPYNYTAMCVKIKCFFLVCQAVKITNINVPATYTIDKTSNDTEILILDCDYDIFQNETGFVLKWLLNDIPIYQWIPNQKPYALVILIENYICLLR